MAVKVFCVGGHLDGRWVTDSGDTMFSMVPVGRPMLNLSLDPPDTVETRMVLYRKRGYQLDSQHHSRYVRCYILDGLDPNLDIVLTKVSAAV